MEYLKDKICILVTHQVQFLNSASKILVLNKETCEIIDNYNTIENLEMLTGIWSDKEIAEKRMELKTELFNDDKIIENTQSNISDDIKDSNNTNVENENKKIPRDDEEDGTIGISVYKEYLNAGASFLFKMFLLIMLVVAQSVTNVSDYWLVKWLHNKRIYTENVDSVENMTFKTRIFNNSEDKNLYYSEEYNVYVYFGLICAVFFTMTISGLLLYNFFIAASLKLHKNMFHCIIRTPISFLDNNPAGKILNRFSKDMNNVDDLLPINVHVALRGLSLIAGMCVLQAILCPYVLILTFVLSMLFYFTWTIHSRVLKSIKLMEGKSRSPVFSHLSVSLYGLTTIRAFKAEDKFLSTFNEYQDKHTATWIIYIALNRCLSIYGHIICYMNSVKRILNYSKLKSEASYESLPDKRPPSDWPQKGKIDFDDVSLQYSKDKNIVLKNLSFRIHSGEKIGIVGRTGAGKSSIIASLFRMTEPTGTITIDGIDTKDIGLRDLRSKISIIPQDPMLFTGPLRRNIDPFNEYSEEILWQVIEEVQLKEVISSLPGGLDTHLSEGGRNFSVGERQLICLARTILRQNKILVMDEATSNIDKNTDSCIQKIIREKFKSCTVLTIAHRLHTIIDSDRVLVLDNGKLQEFDMPYKLLKNVNGTFYNLVKKTGVTSMNELYKIAENKYNVQECMERTSL
ncbi:multidrug resistance-associated protein 4-like isoform X3 [Centruroides sculpturatus]|uniref:multidrug resistance-associated protein 4-like isoform X3 n=1 Tax=Centruroides sculpturatus TaxID=218467 RepID=UPI000C6EA767|nr:multidrug resistance-associated protein 4-like isoform X3 [Centruroides sculpturatus]